MSPRTRLQSELRPTNHRVESFSDGVFAIVITIMVIEVDIPDRLAFSNDPQALATLSSAFATYALSFFVIANLWVSHHYLIFTLKMPSRGTICLNNLVLFCVSTIPLVTRFLGMFPTSSRAAAAYGFVGAACTGSFMLLRTHAARKTQNEAHRDIHHRILRRSAVFLSIYLGSMPLAFVSPWLAWACFISVPPMLFLPIIRAQIKKTESSEGNRGMEHSCP